MVMEAAFVIRESEHVQVLVQAYSVEPSNTTDDVELAIEQVTMLLVAEQDYLSAEDDPVLAALWDNEADAAYDAL